MPIFDTKCTVCGKVKRDVIHSASARPPACDCGGATEHVWGLAPAVHLFREGWYEHLAYDPLYFSSKRRLRDHCKEHGLVMDYTENSTP